MHLLLLQVWARISSSLQVSWCNGSSNHMIHDVSTCCWPFVPKQKDEFLRLVINSVRNDLISRNEAFQCLALDFIANGGRAGQLGTGSSSLRRLLRGQQAAPVAESKPFWLSRLQWAALSSASC